MLTLHTRLSGYACARASIEHKHPHAIRTPEPLSDPYANALHTPACARMGRFTFDHVYDQDSTQEELYLRSAQPVVLSILQVGCLSHVPVDV